MVSKRLAAADFPPELLKWIDAFQEKHGRLPARKDVPRKLRNLIPGDKPKGPPRCDTKRFQAARRAWLIIGLTDSYQTRRETISHLGEYLTSTFGYTPEDVRGDRPNRLALEKLHQETGLSVSRLQDLMGHRKRKS